MNELFERLVALQDEHSENIALYGIGYKNTTLYAGFRLRIALLKFKIEVFSLLSNLLNR